jgi:phage FluMu protein Com
MLINLIIRFKRLVKQNITCSHDYEFYTNGINSGFIREVCPKCGKTNYIKIE